MNAIVIHDIDGTLNTNLFDLNFDWYVSQVGLDRFKSWNRRTPGITTAHVKVALTARPEKYRKATEADLRNLGFENVELIMNSTSDTWHANDFKARVLDEWGADYYVDNDTFTARNIVAMTGGTRAITTDQFEWLVQNSCMCRKVTSFPHF